MSNVAVIIVGHGSRRGSYGECISSMARYIEGRLGLLIYGL
ncbi:hypothetical protein [Caldivirga maquilingensis]|nr:hypothetical protein [Caldivirga maquilingensis]